MLPLNSEQKNNDDEVQSLPTLNILAVDDDVAQTVLLDKSLHRILDKTHMLNIRKLYSGAEALRYLTDESPDLVFLDYKMPGIDGLTILQRMHDTGRTIPMILLTSQSERSVLHEAMRYGAMDFLIKGDFDSARLMQTVFSTLERSAIRKDANRNAHIAAIETLTSGVAHEFNNILQVVIGHAQYALMVATPEKCRAALQFCEKAAMKGTSLVKQLSAFAQNKRLNIAEINLEEVLKSVVEEDKEHAEKAGVKVNIHFSESPIIRGDAAQLEIAFSNIITNARHACTKNKGSVDINYSTIGKLACVHIRDTGIGIEKADLAKVFEPFFTSKGSLGGQVYDGNSFGTGLGLPIAANILHRHSGRIDIKSAVGEGTSVTVQLPLIESERSQPRNRVQGMELSKDTRVVSTLNGVSILIVDDEQMIGKLVSTLLTDEGFVCEYTTSADDALSRAWHRQYDLLLLDLTIPGEIGGREILEKIRKEPGPNRSTPALVMTGHGPGDGDIQLIATGFSGIIRKPFDIATISGMISDVLLERS